MSFRTQLKNRTYFAIALAVVILACNVVCVFLSNENNQKIFLWANIVSDIAVGIFLVWYISAKIIPERKALRLFKNEKETFGGVVQSFSSETLRYADFDCFPVEISDKTYYIVDNGALTFEVGKTYAFQTVSKIVVSVTKQFGDFVEKQTGSSLAQASATERNNNADSVENSESPEAQETGTEKTSEENETNAENSALNTAEQSQNGVISHYAQTEQVADFSEANSLKAVTDDE